MNLNFADYNVSLVRNCNSRKKNWCRKFLAILFPSIRVFHVIQTDINHSFVQSSPKIFYHLISQMAGNGRLSCSHLDLLLVLDMDAYVYMRLTKFYHFLLLFHQSLATGTIVKSRYMQSAEKTSLSKVMLFLFLFYIQLGVVQLHQVLLLTRIVSYFYLIALFNRAIL